MSKPEQYCIYRIVCTVTGKCYIGQTCEVNNRRRAHFGMLNNGTHHSKYLQNAYHLYGASFFYFEILEKGIDKDDVNTQEIYWIDHFDSYKNGFNATRDGRVASPAGIPCTWNGVTYSSMKEAARVTGISQTTLYHRIKRGFTSDDDMRTAKYCEWNGIIYESMEQAAKANNITKSCLRSRLKRGCRNDDDVELVPHPCEWDGVLYESINAAARNTNIAYGTMVYYIKMGYKSTFDIKGKQRSQSVCEWNGIIYESIKEAARACGITENAMGKRLSIGYTCDADVKGRWPMDDETENDNTYLTPIE